MSTDYASGATVGLRMLSTSISITVGVLLGTFLVYAVSFSGRRKLTSGLFAL